MLTCQSEKESLNIKINWDTRELKHVMYVSHSAA